MGWITIRQLALICLWAFFFLSLFFLCLLLRVSVLFVRLLAYGVCPLLLISSALISHFTAAEGTQNVCCCSARTYFGISLGRQVSPTMLMRSKFESSHLPCKWEKCTHTHTHTHKGKAFATEKKNKKKNSPDRDVLLSSQHDHFILPPLHPSHRSICLSSPLFSVPCSFSSFFSPSICLSLSATFVALVVSVQHLPCSSKLSLPPVFSLSFFSFYPPHLLSVLPCPNPILHLHTSLSS